MLLLSLTPENIGEAEALSPAEVIRRLEDRDDAYYAAFPAPEELADRYGDPAGDGLYRDRDLLLLWRRRFARETGLVVEDVTDERFSGSRRY